MKRSFFKRSAIIGAGIILFACLFFIILLLALPLPRAKPQRLGVTFSIPQAQGFGLPWQETYQAILKDLQVKHLRLVAYWDTIEPTKDKYDFRVLDEQMNLAEVSGADVVLTIGRKLPRWPECYVPAWARGEPEKEQQARVLNMLTVLVKRYQHHPALFMWQVENEPLLAFGVCPPADPVFLAQEIALVHSLDSHPVLVTDSGELSWWLKASRFGDVFGTTLYRTVFSGRIHGPFSYDYIYPAWLYRLKGRLVYVLGGQQTVISELQGEPWGNKATQLLSPTERAQSFSPRRFQQIENFSARTQFSSAYWWGAEYWYWEKIHEHNPQFWDQAKKMFRGE